MPNDGAGADFQVERAASAEAEGRREMVLSQPDGGDRGVQEGDREEAGQR